MSPFKRNGVEGFLSEVLFFEDSIGRQQTRCAGRFYEHGGYGQSDPVASLKKTGTSVRLPGRSMSD